MADHQTRTTTKISVKIWQPILDKLEEKLEAACLSRDKYLAQVLATELHYLDQEVSVPNSEASRKFVASQLEQIPRKPVSLVLPSDLAARLGEICERKHIVRDAFWNRVLLLLTARPALIDKLLFDGIDWLPHVWEEFKDDEALFRARCYPLNGAIDPFWAMRAAFDIYAREEVAEDYLDPDTKETRKVKRELDVVVPLDSLYAIRFTQPLNKHDLTGLSCYLPDCELPWTDAQKPRRLSLDDL